MRTLTWLGLGIVASLVVGGTAWGYPTVYPEGTTLLRGSNSAGFIFFPAADGKVYLIKSVGTVLHTWQPACGFNGAVRPLSDGHILLISCGGLVELDWDSQVVWQAPAPAGCTFHHDLERLPNGHTVAWCQQTVSAPALSDKPLVEDYLVEVSTGGSVVWEWHEIDHFDEFGFSQERKDLIFRLGGDFSHANAVSAIPESSPLADPRFKPGNLIISLRHLNTIAVVDPVTDQIAWTLTDTTIGQHSTHMIPGGLPGAGRILVFDNGYAQEWSLVTNRFFSRVLEIDPVAGTIPFTYTANMSTDPRRPGPLPMWSLFAPFISGAQRQPNGNTLITEGPAGRLFEITPAGQLTWEYVIPYRGPTNNSNLSFRAYKVPFGFIGNHLLHPPPGSGSGEPATPAVEPDLPPEALFTGP
ncbi:MAG TPA: aryl-sulfate sulfotransferase [Candidatus Polarisedimenticolaceae bacterium]|nr:aryl-sulfate sulfotransferase [Candidatus Polarisedimenticolaceae bacterium]